MALLTECAIGVKVSMKTVNGDFVLIIVICFPPLPSIPRRLLFSPSRSARNEVLVCGFESFVHENIFLFDKGEFLRA